MHRNLWAARINLYRNPVCLQARFFSKECEVLCTRLTIMANPARLTENTQSLMFALLLLLNGFLEAAGARCVVPVLHSGCLYFRFISSLVELRTW